MKLLSPIKEHTDDFDELEKEIKRVFRKKLYNPILALLDAAPARLSNAKSGSPLQDAIRSGKVSFNRGTFRGKFSASVTKELKELGATWDKAAATFRLPTSKIPEKLRAEIAVSSTKFEKTLDQIDKRLRQIMPEEITEAIDSKKFFDSSLWKVDRKVGNTLKTISVLPKLTDARREKIASEWQNNMNLWIKDFTEKEIKSLRAKIRENAFSGARQGDIISEIQRSYGVTQNKAKFLARQETNLLMAKFKASRYEEAGVDEYKWGCVAGSKNHPVRPSHKALEGKIFKWSEPPITTMPGQPAQRNNPGEDYNCRCFARPVVRAKKVTP